MLLLAEMLKTTEGGGRWMMVQHVLLLYFLFNGNTVIVKLSLFDIGGIPLKFCRHYVMEMQLEQPMLFTNECQQG